MACCKMIALLKLKYAVFPRSDKLDRDDVVYKGKSITGGSWPKSPTRMQEQFPSRCSTLVGNA